MRCRLAGGWKRGSEDHFIAEGSKKRFKSVSGRVNIKDRELLIYCP